LATNEVLPVSLSSLPTSWAGEDNPHVVHLRRHELTSLMLTEMKYFLRVANSILRNEADAEDVVHSSFCAAWKAVATFRGESTLKTWFSRIVTNNALLALKKRNKNKVVFIEDNPEYLHTYERNCSSVVEDPERIMARQQALGLIYKHVEHLPTETRIVWMLYFSRDCSIEQIAELRGKTCRAVSAHLQRGKALLRRSVHKVPARRMQHRP
jgi:RNA polymerase sigma-70 factor (ECF subfamily)